MASLTPLSKGLIGLAVVGAMASAVWHLVLKERMGSGATSDWQSTPTPATPTPNSAQPSSTPAVQAPNTAATDTPGTALITPTASLPAAENFDAGRKLMANGDFAQARKHLEAAVNAGDGGAACLLGEMTLKGQGGISANQDASAKLFQLAQSRGSICFASGQ
jgi:TPR repeat protein